MLTKQTIAIIGTSEKLTADFLGKISMANYRLLLFAKEPKGVSQLAAAIYQYNPAAELEIAECSVNAVWEADIIISVLPYAEAITMAEKIRDVVNQKIVICMEDAGDDRNGAEAEWTSISRAEQLQALLPHSKLVKLFNTGFINHFSNISKNGKPVEILLTGNETDALQHVQELVKSAGLNPVVAGNLLVSRTLENYAAGKAV